MIGRNLLTPQYLGVPLGVTADGFPEWKQIGATIDWAAVAAAAATGAIAAGIAPTMTTATTGGFVPPGSYFCQYTYLSAYGESLGSAEATLTVPAGTSTNTIVFTTPSLPTNSVGVRAYVGTASGGEAFAAQLLHASGSTATVTVTNLPATGAPAVPTLDTSGSADGSITWADLKVPAGSKGLRYGQVLCLGSNGLYGPFDPSAGDSARQALVNGKCGIVNTSRLQNGVLGFTPFDMDHLGLIVGGKVYAGSILATTGTHSLLAGPTWTELLAALPRLQPVYNS